ncbi:STAS-like domain-containing protein [Kocuria sp. CPCC 205258]|uniref:STAS-like domain-containing protein n=1 Tax=Kocuria sp. CPCC 205258 TaxID=3073552 RepID=UPI0034D457D9
MKSTVLMGNLNDLGSVDELVDVVRAGAAGDEICVDMTQCERMFPNGATQFASTVDFGRKKGLHFRLIGHTARMRQDGVVQPYELTADRMEDPVQFRVWKFNTPDEALHLANKFIDHLMEAVPCEDGFLDTLNWCLFEVMDNVFQHSQAEAGFVRMDLHRSQKRVAVSVADHGMGIKKSLAMAWARDASVPMDVFQQSHKGIRWAVGKGHTSKIHSNKGNGLFGLVRSVEINGGRLRIKSTGATVAFSEDADFHSYADGDSYGVISEPIELPFSPMLDIENHAGTVVDWQLDASRPVRINEALGVVVQNSDYIERLTDENGAYFLYAEDIDGYIGSRSESHHLRNRCINLLNNNVQYICFDLRGVAQISSSFADEVFGKLAADLGKDAFRKRIFTLNAKESVLDLIAHSISGRVQ